LSGDTAGVAVATGVGVPPCEAGSLYALSVVLGKIVISAVARKIVQLLGRIGIGVLQASAVQSQVLQNGTQRWTQQL
jgi:hypothetical protein